MVKNTNERVREILSELTNNRSRLENLFEQKKVLLNKNEDKLRTFMFKSRMIDIIIDDVIAASDELIDELRLMQLSGKLDFVIEELK